MAFVARSRKSGFIRGGVARRQTFWIGGTLVSSTMTAAANPVLQTTLNAAALALAPFTVVRTRGLIYVQSDQVAASEDQTVLYGQAVVSDEASAIGVTAIPTPDTDSGSDLWFVYEALMSDLKFSTAAAYGKIGAATVIDSKGMRKVEPGQDIVAVVESASAFGVTIRSFTRTLIKLH